ncbi:peptidoglycan DD-metalloendopeptidase family protein [Paenibacillus terrae]|nr:peptidoglycan DD-metalloendopeptidase family protein [Paenibacillus terrae]
MTFESMNKHGQARGHQPRVIVELDKMSYVRSLRPNQDVVQYVKDTVVKDFLSIDGVTQLTSEKKETKASKIARLSNLPMSMPILSSSKMCEHVTDSNHIQGMLVTSRHRSVNSKRPLHKGVDLDCDKEDTIHAVWDGRITAAGAVKGYGHAVYIHHGNGWTTRYAHLKPNAMMVKVGDHVKAGDPIAIGWNSGHKSSSGGGDGAHLHFEVRKDGEDLNPEAFLRGEKSIQLPIRLLDTTVQNKSIVTPSLEDSAVDSYTEYSMEAWAYYVNAANSEGITRGGTDVRQWKDYKIIAVDPSVIPLGSKVELLVDGNNWGEYVADDTAGSTKGKRIEILMENAEQCLQFGRKPVIVKIKQWGDGRTRSANSEVDQSIPSYQIDRTTEKVSYSKDFTAQKTSLDPLKYVDIVGATQFFTNETPNQVRNVLGFQRTDGAGQVKKFAFVHDWFKAGCLSWAYVSDMDIQDRVEVKVDDQVVATIEGVNAKNGLAYPPSIPVPGGHHKIEFSMSNPSKASRGNFGITFLKAREFDVKSVSAKTVWTFEDPMSTINDWTPDQQVVVTDLGDQQKISTAREEAGIERTGKINKFPFTMQFRIKADQGTQGKIIMSNGSKAFVVKVTDQGVSTNVSSYSHNHMSEYTDYVVTCHNETDMDVYIKSILPGGNEQWENTRVRGVSEDDTTNRLRFSVFSGGLYIAEVKYAFHDYSIEQFATHIADTYKEKWYDVGGFQYEDTASLERDVMNWEVHSHMDMSSTSATVTLNNAKGIYSLSLERYAAFPDGRKQPPNEFTYWEEGERRHLISEGTPIRIYAGYGDELVRVFTGMIKGEIEEDAERRTLTFHCVDRYDMLEEFIFYKDMIYPPEEAYAGDGGAFAWMKSSIVKDIVVAGGLDSWRVHGEDCQYPDLDIDETVYVDVKKGRHSYMRFDPKSGELQTIPQDQDRMKTAEGWENPFVATASFKAGTRASDAIQSLIQDLPYDVRCDRYGTFRLKRMNFLDTPDWDQIARSKWEFTDDHLLEMTSSTDYSRVRNHLMISGSEGLTEHFLDKSLIVATKGNMRTAGLQLPWIEEQDGASMRDLKQQIANKVFFDMKRQARTKNIVIRGNPLIELLDGCYVYDNHTCNAGYYLIKGNRLVGNECGMINYLELTWSALPATS